MSERAPTTLFNQLATSKMSKSHFFKHLSYTVSRSFLPNPSSVVPLSSFKSTGFRCRRIRTPDFLLLFPGAQLSSCSSSSAACSFTSIAESYSFLSVRIRCPKNVADTLSEALLCFGASSVSMDEEDGYDSSQEESFHPVEVTEGLWVVPEWRSPPDGEATNIILNPGLAFGTGEHPTTKLCLLLLHGLIKEGDVFLDYGTGSGILAIAALKFGATRSVGFDIDPQAIKSAHHNAILNNVNLEKIELHLVPGNAKSDKVIEEQRDRIGIISVTEKYDVVIANILLNPLLELAYHIVSYAKPGGVVGLSGILSEQLSYVIDRYSVLLEDISVSELDDWICISGRKKRL